jgi:hypothetical protein
MKRFPGEVWSATPLTAERLGYGAAPVSDLTAAGAFSEGAEVQVADLAERAVLVALDPNGHRVGVHRIEGGVVVETASRELVGEFGQLSRFIVSGGQAFGLALSPSLARVAFLRVTATSVDVLVETSTPSPFAAADFWLASSGRSGLVAVEGDGLARIFELVGSSVLERGAGRVDSVGRPALVRTIGCTPGVPCRFAVAYHGSDVAMFAELGFDEPRAGRWNRRLRRGGGP